MYTVDPTGEHTVEHTSNTVENTIARHNLQANSSLSALSAPA